MISVFQLTKLLLYYYRNICKFFTVPGLLFFPNSTTKRYNCPWRCRRNAAHVSNFHEQPVGIRYCLACRWPPDRLSETSTWQTVIAIHRDSPDGIRQKITGVDPGLSVWNYPGPGPSARISFSTWATLLPPLYSPDGRLKTWRAEKLPRLLSVQNVCLGPGQI